ncbi:hypothetical protein [Halobacillus sp. B23F22_1]|uniref:hypothetical protein n=1 Tax=Halobacillus sp. B23F22_1 TaxID=3459514 RepID=UPI00373F183D
MRLKLRFGNAPHVLMEAEVQILLDSLNIEGQKKISPKLDWIKNKVFNKEAEPIVIYVD